jgi:hypothetical protein
LNQAWVDDWLVRFESALEWTGEGEWHLFASTPRFYDLLAGPEEEGLQEAADQLSSHLRLDKLPTVTYQLGLNRQYEVEGQIRRDRRLRGHIELPVFHVGRPRVLAYLLSRELIRDILAGKGITPVDLMDGERLIDLAAFVLGLGGVVLNGTVRVMVPETGDSRIMGYLSQELKIYAFHQTNQRHQVSPEAALAYLTPHALMMLDSFD